jgi:hypothetical protein
LTQTNDVTNSHDVTNTNNVDVTRTALVSVSQTPNPVQGGNHQTTALAGASTTKTSAASYEVRGLSGMAFLAIAGLAGGAFFRLRRRGAH